MVPAALTRPSHEAGDRRLRDNIKACVLADMPSSTIHGIEQMSTARTGNFPLRSIHEAVEDLRVVRTEQLRHPHLLRHVVRANPFKYIVLGNLAARWQIT